MNWEEMKSHPVSLKPTGGESRLNTFSISFVSKDRKILRSVPYNSVTSCRDHITDDMLIHFNAKAGEPSGTNSVALTHQKDIDLSKFNLYINASSFAKGLYDLYALHVLDFLWQIEEIFGFCPTRIYPVESTGIALLIEGDPNWLKAPPLNSLYTLILRSNLIPNGGTPFHIIGDAFYNTINKIVNSSINTVSSSDKLQFREAEKGIKRILKYGHQEIFGTLENIRDNHPEAVFKTGYAMYHSNSGIVAFSSNTLNKNYPQKWRDLPEVNDSFEKLVKDCMATK